MKKLKTALKYKITKAKARREKQEEWERHRTQAAVDWCDYLLGNLGEEGGQCKTYIYHAFHNYTGLTLAQNDTENPYKWKDRVVGIGPPTNERFELIHRIEHLAIGDMVQIEYKKHLPEGLHTLVVLSYDMQGMEVVDSNFLGDEIVHKHYIVWDWWKRNVKRFTAYRFDFTQIER